MGGFKRFAAWWVCGALLLTVQSFAWGQDTKEEKKPAPKPPEMKSKEGQPPAGDPAHDEMMKAMQAAAAPGPHHELFKTLAGKWKATVKSYHGGPEPDVSEGSAEFEPIMGGRFLKQTFKGTMMGQPFEGTGFMGYDNMTKKHTGFWIDSMGTGMATSEGTSCDAGHKNMTSVLSFVDPMTGSPSKCKEELKMPDENTLVFTMYGPGEGGAEQKMMEITYKRM